jgi:hypothetical protein
MRESQIRFIRQQGFSGEQFPDSFYTALMLAERVGIQRRQGMTITLDGGIARAERHRRLAARMGKPAPGRRSMAGLLFLGNAAPGARSREGACAHLHLIAQAPSLTMVLVFRCKGSEMRCSR